MIQTSAKIANSVIGIASTKVASGSASAGAMAGDGQKSGFSALLDDTDAAQSGTDTTNNTAAATEAAAQAQRALQTGNNGKHTGKTLPPEEETSANPETSGETEEADPSEVSSTPEGANSPVVSAALFALPVSPLTQATDNQSSAASVQHSAGTVTTMAARLDASMFAKGLSTEAAALSTAAASNAAAPSAVAAAAANATLSDEVASLRLAPVELVAADDTATATLPSTADRLINSSVTSATQPATLASKVATAQTTVEAQAKLAADEAIKGKANSGASAVETTPKTATASTTSEALIAAEPALQENTAFSVPVPPATSGTSETTLASSFQSAAQVEGPQDFATLVSRLNEAREASGGQVVRTALSHHEFGKVSLQFSHQDGGLSVTMASADPTFAGAAQVAAASLASNNGEQPRDNGSQQQQQQQHSNNQHSGFTPQQTGQQSLGTGAGRQDQQARSEQAGNTARGASASASGSESDASASREQGGTRSVGGVYA